MKTEFKIEKQKSNGATLVIKGGLSVQVGHEFKEHLSSLLNATGDVTISLEEIENIDVSAIQLLCAFKKTWKGKLLIILWPQQGEIHDLIIKTNIKRVFK